jgi:hypothetical protein
MSTGTEVIMNCSGALYVFTYKEVCAFYVGTKHSNNDFEFQGTKFFFNYSEVNALKNGDVVDDCIIVSYDPILVVIQKDYKDVLEILSEYKNFKISGIKALRDRLGYGLKEAQQVWEHFVS